MSLIKESVLLLEEGRYPGACFLAMTSIDEAGKLTVLRFFAHKRAQELGIPELPAGDPKAIIGFLRDHSDKAAQAATWSFYVNSGADRRHGMNPKSGIVRTSGIILLVRSGNWMNV